MLGIKENQRIEYTFDCAGFLSDARLKSGQQTLRELQAVTGVSASTWSRIDKGTPPDLETFMKVCGRLQMEPENYFDKQVWELKK